MRKHMQEEEKIKIYIPGSTKIKKKNNDKLRTPEEYLKEAIIMQNILIPNSASNALASFLDGNQQAFVMDNMIRYNVIVNVGYKNCLKILNDYYEKNKLVKPKYLGQMIEEYVNAVWLEYLNSDKKVELWPKLDIEIVNNTIKIFQKIYLELINEFGNQIAYEIFYNYLLVQDLNNLPYSEELKKIIGNNSPRIVLLNYFNDNTLNPYDIDSLINRFNEIILKENREKGLV